MSADTYDASIASSLSYRSGPDYSPAGSRDMADGVWSCCTPVFAYQIVAFGPSSVSPTIFSAHLAAAPSNAIHLMCSAGYFLLDIIVEEGAACLGSNLSNKKPVMRVLYSAVFRVLQGVGWLRYHEVVALGGSRSKRLPHIPQRPLRELICAWKQGK